MPKVNTNMPKKARLDEICEIIAGQSPSSDTYNDVGEGLPFYQGKADFGELHPRARKWCNAPVKLAQKNDVLVSVRAPVGPCNIANDTCCIGRGLAAVRAKPEVVLPKYIYWAIKQSEPALAAMSTGTTFAAITRKDLANLEVSLPLLDEQQRIVDILDRAASIQRLRQAADEKLKQIIPALFVDMFGDPATNPKGWPESTIGDLILSADYGSSSKAHEEAKGLPMLRMSNVTMEGALDLSSLKYVELEQTELAKFKLQNGDILFNRTNSKELVGKTGIWDGRCEAVYASYFIRLRTKPDLMKPEVLWAFMNSKHTKGLLFGMARGAIGQSNINSKELKAIRINVPPLGLQEGFVSRLNGLRSLQQLSHKATEAAILTANATSATFFGV